MISIIIPVYNSEKIIGKCLKSIFNQTYNDFEVIAVNDGSTDNSLEILKQFENRIKIYNQTNKGAPNARNFGFDQSKGEYVIFCDDDVIMNPRMLEKMIKILNNNPDCGFVYSSFKFGWKKFKLWPFDREKLKQIPFIHTTALIRRNVFPRFDESLKRFQDWDIFLTMAENGIKGIWINEVLYQVKTGGTMSKWLPKFLYNFPWLKQVKKYDNAKKIIQKKHKI